MDAAHPGGQGLAKIEDPATIAKLVTLALGPASARRAAGRVDVDQADDGRE